MNNVTIALRHAGFAVPVVLGMACAPVVYRPGSPPQRIVSTEAEVRTLLDVAKAKLNEAALAGNIEGVLDRFTPGAVVVVEGRDTLRGRASIAAWLTAHAEGKAAARVGVARAARLGRPGAVRRKVAGARGAAATLSRPSGERRHAT